jgi:hypothetical protein
MFLPMPTEDQTYTNSNYDNIYCNSQGNQLVLCEEDRNGQACITLEYSANCVKYFSRLLSPLSIAYQ